MIDSRDEAAAHSARIRCDLRARGMMIGANDLFIAAHSRALGPTLVTNDTGGFGRVAHLMIENWAERATSARTTIRRARSVVDRGGRDAGPRGGHYPLESSQRPL